MELHAIPPFLFFDLLFLLEVGEAISFRFHWSGPASRTLKGSHSRSSSSLLLHLHSSGSKYINEYLVNTAGESEIQGYRSSCDCSIKTSL